MHGVGGRPSLAISVEAGDFRCGAGRAAPRAGARQRSEHYTNLTVSRDFHVQSGDERLGVNNYRMAWVRAPSSQVHVMCLHLPTN